jgi:hypothetical protein
LNHFVLEHLSGVKGGFPLEEAYYLKLSLFQGVEYFGFKIQGTLVSKFSS